MKYFNVSLDSNFGIESNLYLTYCYLHVSCDFLFKVLITRFFCCF